jgi:large subunit ribosomal protein L29
MAEFKRVELRAQLREMTDEQIRAEIDKQRAALFDYRRRNAMRQLDNTAAIREARKQIARALTIVRQREKAGEGV